MDPVFQRSLQNVVSVRVILSPPYLLFFLCMEKLSLLIESKVASREWAPVPVARGDPSISHLLFADDVLLFSHAAFKQCQVVLDTMKQFCACSGMLVNEQKSRVYLSPCTRHLHREALRRRLHLFLTSDFACYLGVPLHSRCNKAAYRHILFG